LLCNYPPMPLVSGKKQFILIFPFLPWPPSRQPPSPSRRRRIHRRCTPRSQPPQPQLPPVASLPSGDSSLQRPLHPTLRVHAADTTLPISQCRRHPGLPISQCWRRPALPISQHWRRPPTLPTSVPRHSSLCTSAPPSLSPHVGAAFSLLPNQRRRRSTGRRPLTAMHGARGLRPPLLIPTLRRPPPSSLNSIRWPPPYRPRPSARKLGWPQGPTQRCELHKLVVDHIRDLVPPLPVGWPPFHQPASTAGLPPLLAAGVLVVDGVRGEKEEMGKEKCETDEMGPHVIELCCMLFLELTAKHFIFTTPTPFRASSI
jgi:hypothetical protein